MLAAAVLAAVWSTPVLAQRRVPTSELVDRITQMVRDNLTMARLEDGTNVPAETAEERAKEIVPRALEIQTIQRGELDAQMQICGLDWSEGSFLPYMAKLRASGRYSGKQMAYLGLLHGATQGFALDGISETGIACPDQLRPSLLDEAAGTTIETP